MAISSIEFYLAPLSANVDSPGGRNRGDQREEPHEGVAPASRRLPDADEVLVARVRLGDERAFSELVREYGERLFRFTYRELHSRESAEEVVQDVFSAVWARHTEWVVTGTVATYLFQSVRHRILNVRRAQRTSDRLHERLREEFGEGDAPFVPLSLSAPTAALEEAELRAALGRALARLPERPRQVFHLSREQHLTFREIADVLELSVRTVEHHMARAISTLRRELADWLA